MQGTVGGHDSFMSRYMELVEKIWSICLETKRIRFSIIDGAISAFPDPTFLHRDSEYPLWHSSCAQNLQTTLQ
jgi:hypothetical protein